MYRFTQAVLNGAFALTGICYLIIATFVASVVIATILTITGVM